MGKIIFMRTTHTKNYSGYGFYKNETAAAWKKQTMNPKLKATDNKIQSVFSMSLQINQKTYNISSQAIHLREQNLHNTKSQFQINNSNFSK